MIAVPIVTFWLIMMGQLLSREAGVERLEAGERPREDALAASESWLAILAEGQRIGHVQLRQIPEARHGEMGQRMTLAARVRLRLLGKGTDLDLSGSVWQPQERARAEFDFTVRSAGFDFRIAGDVDGGELRGEMISAGEVIPLRMPVDEDLIFSSGLGSALRFPRLDVGDETRLDSFDPLTLSKSRARVKCTAREKLRIGAAEVSTCRLTVTTGGLSMLAWVDDEGQVVRAETAIGWVLERMPPARARAAPGLATPQTPAGDLLDGTAIRPSGRRPFRSARTMTVRLAGLEDLTLPEDRVQTALGAGIYRVKVPIEVDRGSAEVDPGSEARRYLRPDAFVQSDHPKIRRQAAAVTTSEEDPWRRSVKIHDWVFSRLDKEPVLSIPSALEVLEQMRGDCNEHTVLFTALARAASVPTRIAIGVVWSDELEGFYYHAWPEVYLEAAPLGPPGSGWFWMDPTLGQSLADATHIKLLNGGIETWPQLLPYLGKLEIEVLEIG